MKTIFEHIEHVQKKPHHVRKRVALSVAAAGTAMVAFVWLIGSISLGEFALKASTFADSTESGSAQLESVTQPSGFIAGAGAATGKAVTTPHIEIVNVGASVSTPTKVAPTVLTF